MGEYVVVVVVWLCVCGGCNFWICLMFPNIFDVGNGYGDTLG